MENTIESIFEARKTELNMRRQDMRNALTDAVENALRRGKIMRNIDGARALVERGTLKFHFSDVMPSDKAWLLETHHFVVYEENGWAYVKPDGLEELLKRQKAQDDEINGIVE